MSIQTDQPAEKSATAPAPPRPSRGTSLFRDVLVVLPIAWATRWIFILVLPPTARSFDSYSWETVAKALAAGQNPYHTTAFLNWPPLWMELIFLISKFSAAISLPFFRSLQLFLITVETVVIVLVIQLIRQIAPAARLRALVIAGIALNPAAILLICQHGNFDVLVALWLLLFIGSLLRFNRTDDPVDWLSGCLFLGLGILTKTVPLVLVPLLAGGFRRATTRARFLGLILLLGPIVTGMSVIYVLAPHDVMTKVVEYRSTGGFFGISGLLHVAKFDSAVVVTNAIFYAALVAILIACSILFWRHRSLGDAETILLAALLLAFPPAFGPGYSPQYLYWFLPFLVVTLAAAGGEARLAVAVFLIIAALTYLVEYALLRSHGMFLVHMLMDKSDRAPSWFPLVDRLVSSRSQTLARLPLFIAYIELFVAGTKMILPGVWTQRR